MVGMDDELMEIGRFAAATGLSVPALRHYDDVGILNPAEVDVRTSYRRYHPRQIIDARRICSLRGIDLPIEELRRILATDDDHTIQAVLLQHRSRLADQADRLDRMLATAQTYLRQGVPVPAPKSARPIQIMMSTKDFDQSVQFYSQTFGWSFNSDISSFQIGAYNTDSFFLLTIENWYDEATPSCCGIVVDDIDAVHQRALQAGAIEVQAPADFAWKPRSSIIDDPSGNRIQLSQG